MTTHVTAAEAAQILGISRWTIKSWVRRRQVRVAGKEKRGGRGRPKRVYDLAELRARFDRSMALGKFTGQ